ncbi:hypothetical protein I3843_05G001700 [Carya illinoinensis]|nr:hypothetical protein I3760_05G001700 [Carya illinoinensis]KAG2704385.1 hypothetical protein I3760_05G001700 [Carya illinoinensis]KAG7976863.1 hypothetical protein I3843_05G001700 [Carya illinoinensis]
MDTKSKSVSLTKRGFLHLTNFMRMMKAVKKLKFWSRKKRRKNHVHEPYYPPSTCHCGHSYYSTQPSAPPLPPWLDLEQTCHPIPSPVIHALPDLTFPSQNQLSQQEIVFETTSIMHPVMPAATSYQQYMAPNPVYGVPLVQTTRRERRAGFFGCVINFGIHLIRCFCPCVRIREV